MTEQRAAKTRALITAGGTDTERWADDGTYQAAWSERHALIVAAIQPGDVVIDLGSGPGVIGRHLPAGCSYIPVDVVPRGPGSVVCDLNAESVPELAGDFVVMSGVVEYLHDPLRALAGAAQIAERGAVSYSPTDLLGDPDERRGHGWVNDLTEAQFRHLLDEAGWHVTATDDWWVQRIFHVARHG